MLVKDIQYSYLSHLSTGLFLVFLVNVKVAAHENDESHSLKRRMRLGYKHMQMRLLPRPRRLCFFSSGYSSVSRSFASTRAGASSF